MKTKITIPVEHYVGMRSQGGGLPLAFITPNGTDKSSIGRIQTVDNWARGNSALDSTVIENVPLCGFKLTCDIRRSGRFGAGDKWCIEDPRGFELEISSTNLAYLVQNCIIENGIILDPCIWARQSGNNVLLSTLSQEYLNAVQYTQIKNKTESIKNVQKGNTIILQNGVVGTYLGRYHMLKRPYKENKIVALQPATSHVIEIEGATNTLWVGTTLKISSIKDTSLIDDVAAEKKVNQILNTKGCKVLNHYAPIAAFAKKPITWSISVKEVKNAYDALSKNYNRNVIVKLKNGLHGLVDFYGDGHKEYSCFVIDLSLIEKNELHYMKQKISSNRRRSTFGAWQTEENIIEDFDETDVDAVYNVELYSETKLGNIINKKL